MKTNLTQKLENEIRILNKIILPLKEEQLMAMIATEISIFSQGVSIFEKTGLTSPYKQYLYLCNLLLSREKNGDKNVEISDYQKIKKQLQNIVNIYGLLYFDFTDVEEEEEKYLNRDIVKTVMPYFLNYFNTSDLTFEDKKIEKLKLWFGPFSNEVKSKIDLDIYNLIDIYTFMHKVMERNFMDAIVLAEEIQQLINYYGKTIFSESQFSDSKFHSMRELFNKRIGLIDKQFKISIKELEAEFGNEITAAFINTFSTTRLKKPIKYYTEYGEFLDAPLYLDTEKQELIVPIYRELLNSYERVLIEVLRKTNWNSFLTNRDKVTEEKTMQIFKNIFGENTKYFSSVFETSDSQFEHDILILHDDVMITCEVKASFLKEPFRDPRKAFQRLEREFKSDCGIQKAYEQARRLNKIVEKANGQVSLFNKKGEEVVVINCSDIKKFYEICITSEDFSILAVNLSLLLSKEKNDKYPWACSLHSLELINEGFQYRKFSTDMFLQYLEQRNLYHEQFYATDELEVAGMYLMNSSLDFIDNLDVDILTITPDASDIFDDIHMKNLGYDISVEFDKPLHLTNVNKEMAKIFKKLDSSKHNKKIMSKKSRNKISKSSKKANRK